VSGPADARHIAVLLPGGLSNATFFDLMLIDKRLDERSVRLVAATPPGFGGLPAPKQVDFEWYASISTELAVHVGADVVAGHSFGANVALEMAASRQFTGPVALLSPSFSMVDEEKSFQTIARLSTIPLLGRIPFALLPFSIDSMTRRMVPEQYSAEVAREMKKTDMGDARRQVAAYAGYQARNKTLVERLRQSGVRAVCVFGDDDEIGLTDAERAAIASSPTISVVTVEHSGHMLMHWNPEATLTTILDLIE
jgi:pimeloyl-ACP methyl ester carboxylesterase